MEDEFLASQFANLGDSDFSEFQGVRHDGSLLP